MARKILAEGNWMLNSYFSMSGMAHVTIELRDNGEDECMAVLEDGVMYAYKNGECLVCSNLFRVDFVDATKK